MISLIPETKLRAPKKGEKEFDQLYSDNAQYGKVMFWDDRYLRDPEPFEWYYPYKYFRTIINDNIAKEARILVAGCGNSHMVEDLVLDGFLDVTALDISRVVIDQMKKRCTDFPEIKFITANMTDTNLPPNSYDCIIDKAMLDSILCNLKGEEFVQSLVSEVSTDHTMSL
jgi:SAM-dependent methyltransferase